jgi:hypothetical protein
MQWRKTPFAKFTSIVQIRRMVLTAPWIVLPDCFQNQHVHRVTTFSSEIAAGGVHRPWRSRAHGF